MSDRLFAGCFEEKSLQVRGLLAVLLGCVAGSLLGLPAKGQTVGNRVEPQTEVSSAVPEATEGLPGLSQPQRNDLSVSPESVSPAPIISHLSELDQPATTIEDWVAQIEASLVQITDVRVEATEAGLQVVLETEAGSLEVPQTRTVGNALIADINSATIAEDFSQAEPIAGIALVSVTQLPSDRVRVAITGTDAPPVAEVRSEEQGLVLGVAIGQAGTEAEDEAIQIVVTGEEGYNPSNASTATRTDTPLRDIPQSITVVPREVLDDRNVTNLTEAVETVSGVNLNYGPYGSPVDSSRSIRGFSQPGNLRNGFRDGGNFTPVETIEQVEVLRGPASVLFGSLEPGGVINVITRQPLAEPYYRLGFEVGNFEQYQPSIDLSGPLTTDRSILYRLIAAYEGRSGFQDSTQIQTTTIAPSLTFRLGDQTDLNLYYEYARYYANPSISPVALLSENRLPPRNFFPSYGIIFESVNQRVGYELTHAFNNNLQIRNSFSASFSTYSVQESYFFGEVMDDRVLSGFRTFVYDATSSNYFGQLDLVGEFETGSISHRILVGFDLNRNIRYLGSFDDESNAPDLDIFNPQYDFTPDFPTVSFMDQNIVQSYGLYLQDQISLSDNLKLLIGGRYDWLSSNNGLIDGDRTIQNDGAFSPRIGLVYQPSQNISLYTSYSQSFNQSIGRNPDNEPFEPTRGTQYEVGARIDFFAGRLSSNLAAYYLTKTNVLTPDPDPQLARQGFQVQTGEVRSQGIELDVTGEVLLGWNIIVSYALTDTEVTDDNSIPSRVGNRLGGVPLHQASLWTTYELQEGDLQGLGFGLGLFYVGERQNLTNSFELDDYLRTDAALFYRRGRFETAINIRNLFNIDHITNSSDRFFNNRSEPFTITGSISWEF